MTSLRAPLAFTTVTLIQQFRDRASIFFMFALPVAIMAIIGTTFGGAQEWEIGVVGDDPLADGIVAAAERVDDVSVTVFDTAEEGRQATRRYDVEGVILLDEDPPAFVADETSQDSIGARSIAQRLLDEALFEGDPAAGPTVTTAVVGENEFAGRSPFSLTAAQNLVLFTFITAFTAGVIVVRARRSGVLARALSTAAGFGAVTVGLMSAWFVLAMVQSLIIVVVGVFFGVDWGSPSIATVLLILFAMVGSGAGLLVGTLFPSEDMVNSAGPPIALVLGALGGCMVPIEVFPDSILAISRLTPHYWALEGWKASIFDDAGLSDVVTEVMVLAGIAVALVVASSVALRRMSLR